MAYEHDIFLSYPHGFIEEWVQSHFLPLFRWHLEGALGRIPSIFIDREGISAGDSWPLRLKNALAHSRCLVPIWAPSYFDSKWCTNECNVMLHRENTLNYRTTRNPTGLVLPVNVSDGSGFPNYANAIQYFDCRDYVLLGSGFAASPKYVEFQLEMKEWARKVAEAVMRAPQWKRKWLNDPVIAIPVRAVIPIEQPTL